MHKYLVNSSNPEFVTRLPPHYDPVRLHQKIMISFIEKYGDTPQARERCDAYLHAEGFSVVVEEILPPPPDDLCES